MYVEFRSQNYINITFHQQGITFTIEGDIEQENVIFQLHERNQSTFYQNALSFGKSVFFRFKHGYRG